MSFCIAHASMENAIEALGESRGPIRIFISDIRFIYCARSFGEISEHRRPTDNLRPFDNHARSGNRNQCENDWTFRQQAKWEREGMSSVTDHSRSLLFRSDMKSGNNT